MSNRDPTTATEDSVAGSPERARGERPFAFFQPVASTDISDLLLDTGFLEVFISMDRRAQCHAPDKNTGKYCTPDHLPLRLASAFARGHRGLALEPYIDESSFYFALGYFQFEAAARSFELKHFAIFPSCAVRLVDKGFRVPLSEYNATKNGKRILGNC